MEIKVLLVLFALVGSSMSELISCEYSLRMQSQYMCTLSIQNPNGWDNYTRVDGSHFPGMNNVFVTAIVRNPAAQITTNVPQILCSQFPHTTYMDLSYLEIQDVGENAFRGCRNLDWLRLYNNRINRLPENLFIHNRHLNYLDLERNLFTTFPENLFANQLALEVLNLNNNPFTNFPTGVFRNLWNLQILYVRNARLSSINPGWFENLINLRDLDLSTNPITQTIPGNAFRNLISLEQLNLAYCGIRTMHSSWFQGMANLHYIFMYNNQLQTIPSNPFINSPSVNLIAFGSNHIREISPNAFANMPNLIELSLENNNITRLHPRWFEEKSSLTSVYFDFNQIISVPVGIFSQLSSLRSLSLWANNIRTISRNAFGSLANLWFLDLDDNQINSVDERLLREATALTYLYFNENVCINRGYFNFANNIEEFIGDFYRCSRNFGYFTERTTDAGSNYNFVPGFNPGMHVEVNSEEEARIALTPFDIAWSPMVEVVFNTDTISIVRNQVTEVAVVPSQGQVFRPGAWNSYRISWSRQVILVFEGNDDFPFIAYTMQDWYPIGFLGLRSQQSQASWTVEPIQIPAQGPGPRVA